VSDVLVREKPTLILDKNVLQGISRADYLALGEQFHLVMPDVLFFECLKATSSERASCFRTLPAGDRPIVLTHNFAHHLRHELEHGQPLGRPSEHTLEFNYRFNPKLLEVGPLPPEVTETIETLREEHLAKVPEYVERIRAMHARLSVICSERAITRPAAVDAIQAELLDLPTIREFMRDVRSPDGREYLRSVELLERDSAVIVHFQISHALALRRALDQGRDFEDEATVERLTSDLSRELFDAEYLMLGVLEGGLATHEKRLRRLFHWLRPEGLLWPPWSN